ncbi:MAG: membrane dipeptidase [Roseobacter sp.]
MAASGGSSGAVGYPAFVSKNKQPSMDDMVGMIDYMVEVMGVDHVTCGIDHDATTNGVMPAEEVRARYDMLVANGSWDPSAYPAPPYYYPEGIELPNTFFNLTDALLGRGYNEEDIGKIWGGNWLRVTDTVRGDPDTQIFDDDEDTPDGVPHLHKH